jgi:hypothetical protein
MISYFEKFIKAIEYCNPIHQNIAQLQNIYRIL